MKIILDKKKGLKTSLTVLIEKENISDEIEKKLNELKQQVNLKGFRPGKVPIKVLRNQFGKIVYHEVLEKILKDNTNKILEEKKIKVAGQPKIDLKKYDEGKDIEYTIEVESLPEIQTKGIENIKITNYEIQIEKKDIDERLDEIAKNQNNFIEKKENELSKNGDLVIFDYEAQIENEKINLGENKNIQIVLGKDLFIEGFDKQLIGCKKFDKKIVEVNLPKNYPKQELANKKAKFTCKINNVKIPAKVQIDEQFAKNLGADNLIDLKDKISTQIRNDLNNTLNSITKKKITDDLEKFKDFEIPNNLIDQEMISLNANLKKEEIEKNKKENLIKAKKRIKIGLILNEFGEQNKLKVNDEEMQNEIQKQMQMMPGQANQLLDYYKKNPSATAILKGEIYEDKIVNLIKNKAKTILKKITVEEAKKIILDITNDNSEKISDKKKEKPKKSIKTSSKQKKIRKK